MQFFPTEILRPDKEYIILLLSKQKEIKCTSYKEDKPVLWWVLCLRKPKERKWKEGMERATTEGGRKEGYMPMC